MKVFQEKHEGDEHPVFSSVRADTGPIISVLIFGGGHLRCGSVNSAASINNHIGFLNLRPQFVRDVSTQAGGEGRGWEGRGVETDEANF